MNLETKKIILTYLGISLSLIFGLIGTTFETHKKDAKGESIPTKWLWIALIGLVASAVISGTSTLIDNKLKDIEKNNSEIKQRKQDSITQIMVGNLKATLSKAESLQVALDISKVKQDKSLTELQGINSIQRQNTIQQQVVLENTKKALAPPLYPLRLGIHYTINYKKLASYRGSSLEVFINQVDEERHYTVPANIPKGLIRSADDIVDLRPPYNLFHYNGAYWGSQEFAINLNSHSKCGDTNRNQIGPVNYFIGMKEIPPNKDIGSFEVRINFRDSLIHVVMFKPFAKMLQPNIDGRDYNNLYDLIGTFISVKGSFYTNVQLQDITFMVGNSTLRRINFSEQMKCSNAQNSILYEHKINKKEIEYASGAKNIN